MTETISVRFDRNLQKDLSKIEKKWHTGRSEVVRRLLAGAIKEWKLENCIQDIKEHKISIGAAAEECDVSVGEFLVLIREKNIDWIGYSKEDMHRDIALLG